MARGWRWIVVLAGVGVLLASPSLAGLVPGRAAAVPAVELLTRIERSAATPYSGYASATGRLALPVTGQFDSVAQLLGGTTQLRVWWRGPRDWRVDSLAATGETDQHRTPTGLWTWEYEDNRATLDEALGEPAARLPVAADLLPSGLARRLLTDATSAEVGALPSRRVAGRDTRGLRLRPADRRTTIDHVDVWADAASAIPLRVDVVGVRSAGPTMSSQFSDFSTAVPAASVTAFSPPDGARVRERVIPDLVAFLARFGDVVPPEHARRPAAQRRPAPERRDRGLRAGRDGAGRRPAPGGPGTQRPAPAADRTRGRRHGGRAAAVGRGRSACCWATTTTSPPRGCSPAPWTRRRWSAAAAELRHTARAES